MEDSDIEKGGVVYFRCEQWRGKWSFAWDFVGYL